MTPTLLIVAMIAFVVVVWACGFIAGAVWQLKRDTRELAEIRKLVEELTGAQPQ
jgi:hypothetical protein